MIFAGTIKQMQQRREWPTFNIRKVQRKGQNRHAEDFALFTPDCEYEKYPEIPTYTNLKREKELIIDYSVNEAILNSKAYGDLKQTYLENKRKNAERKQALEEEVAKLRKEREEAVEEERRLEMERRKYEELLNSLKEKIMYVRERSRETRQIIQGRMSNEAEYLSNLLISMRFQAEYEHDIDPDQMTYEELLELEEKIGSVSRGLTPHQLAQLPTEQLAEGTEDQCTVCFCPMEQGETVTQLPLCRHRFHNECVVGWLAKEKVCPLCKQEVAVAAPKE